MTNKWYFLFEDIKSVVLLINISIVTFFKIKVSLSPNLLLKMIRTAAIVYLAESDIDASKMTKIRFKPMYFW